MVIIQTRVVQVSSSVKQRRVRLTVRVRPTRTVSKRKSVVARLSVTDSGLDPQVEGYLHYK